MRLTLVRLTSYHASCDACDLRELLELSRLLWILELMDGSCILPRVLPVLRERFRGTNGRAAEPGDGRAVGHHGGGAAAPVGWRSRSRTSRRARSRTSQRAETYQPLLSGRRPASAGREAQPTPEQSTVALPSDAEPTDAQPGLRHSAEPRDRLLRGHRSTARVA